MNDHSLIRICKKIRSTRQEMNLTLQDIADRAGISKGLVSKIENGRTIPSLPVLISIIKALNKDLGSFFEDIDTEKGGMIIHHSQADYYFFQKEESKGFNYQFLLGNHIGNVPFEMVLLELLPGSEREMVTTDAYELKYVLQGRLDYKIGDDILELHEGDSLFFDGRIPHVPVNKTEDTVKLLIVYFFN